jgi:glycosyltransferase involved in cell wall biosynthesis
MAMGVPVITSEAGAGGVDAIEPQHLLVGRSPRETAQYALGLMSSAGERARLAAAGRARVLSHHDWAASMRRLDGIVERCLAGGGAASPGVQRGPQPLEELA